tara:strand:- start:3256 stop:4335 length:1080 start_codon:yes stop_codon:yes gene_type:complete
MRKKIIFILPSFSGGGAEQVIITLINHINREEFDPILIVINESGPLRYKLESDIRVIDLKSKRLRSGFLSLILMLRSESPEIIISTFGYLNVFLLAIRPLLHSRPRIIIREANTPSKSISFNRYSLFLKFLYKRLYKKANKVICNSDIVIREISENFNVPSPIVYKLHNPIDTMHIQSEAKILSQLRNEKLQFVAAGRLSYQKGFDLLIEDFSRSPINYNLTILGLGPDHDILKHAIQKHGLEKRVKLEGFQENPWSFFASADALLISSRWEGMPNVALEALACGTPIIATPESGGILEIKEKSVRGSVTIARSGSEFVDALLSVKKLGNKKVRPSLLGDPWDISRIIKDFEKLLIATD